MTSRLLAGFANVELEGFKQDFFTLIKMTIELDKEYGAADEETFYNLPVYKHYVATFNRKYPGIFVLFTESSVGFRLKIFFRGETDVKKIFINSASKIEGLSSVGSDAFNRGKVNNKRELELELKRVRTKLYINYAGHESLFLHYNEKQEMVELVYSSKNLLNDDSPAYKLCAYFSLRKGCKEEINLKNIAGKFSSTATGTSRVGLGPRR